jgi:hypothetical protein
MALYQDEKGFTVHCREREVTLAEVRQALGEAVDALDALPEDASTEEVAAAIAKSRAADGLATQYAQQHGLEVLDVADFDPTSVASTFRPLYHQHQGMAMHQHHLKKHTTSYVTVCGEQVDVTALLAEWGRTYGVACCLDCAEEWRAEQRDAGVDVALLDVERLDGLAPGRAA